MQGPERFGGNQCSEGFRALDQQKSSVPPLAEEPRKGLRLSLTLTCHWSASQLVMRWPFLVNSPHAWGRGGHRSMVWVGHSNVPCWGACVPICADFKWIWVRLWIIWFHVCKLQHFEPVSISNVLVIFFLIQNNGTKKLWESLNHYLAGLLFG